MDPIALIASYFAVHVTSRYTITSLIVRGLSSAQTFTRREHMTAHGSRKAPPFFLAQLPTLAINTAYMSSAMLKTSSSYVNVSTVPRYNDKQQ